MCSAECVVVVVVDDVDANTGWDMVEPTDNVRRYMNVGVIPRRSLERDQRVFQGKASVMLYRAVLFGNITE